MVCIIKCNGKIYSGMRWNPHINKSELIFLDNQEETQPTLFLSEEKGKTVISKLNILFPNVVFEIGMADELRKYHYSYKEFVDLTRTSDTNEDSVSELDIIEVTEYGTEQD